MAVEEQRRCTRCGEVKPVTDFPREGKARSRYPYCKPCKASYMRERRLRIIAELGEDGWRRIVAEYNIRRYGITLDDFTALIERQGGGCAICGSATPTGNHGRLVVDHDHETGAVRGVLCGDCNAIIGLAKESAARLRAAADYIERSR